MIKHYHKYVENFHLEVFLKNSLQILKWNYRKMKRLI